MNIEIARKGVYRGYTFVVKKYQEKSIYPLFGDTSGFTTWYCGYVVIPEDHPCYGLDYEEVEEDIDVHGGLTFSGEFDQGIYANARGRSGLASRGILCHPGLVDSGYRGEIGVVLTNLSGKDFKIVKGDRVAQLEFRLETRVALRRDKSISKNTYRGEKGFGSSGR